MKLRRTYAPWLQKGEIYAYPDLNFMLHLSDAIYAFDVLLEPCIIICPLLSAGLQCEWLSWFLQILKCIMYRYAL